MNTKINVLRQQSINIHKILLEELHLSAKLYENSMDVEFQIEDHYKKFILFSIYRSIESLIRLLVDDRKNSINKHFYNILCINIKSYFIKEEFFDLILKDIKIEEMNIKYIDVFEYIKNDVLTKIKIKPLEINEIKPMASAKTDIIDPAKFLQKYKDCANKRNKLMHIASSINLDRNTITNSLFIYGYISIIIDNLLAIKTEDPDEE